MKTLLLFPIFFFTVMFSQGQWDSTFLSEITQQMGGAALGTRAYFAGGVVYQPDDITTNKVEIYDVISKEWQISSLSNSRKVVTGVVSGSKVFFAGGTSIDLSTCFSTVDIFDTLTQAWTVGNLLVPRFALAAESKGNIVLFAGGVNPWYNEAYDVVDIYNTETDAWTTAALSIPRSAMGSTVVGDLAMFAGGYDLNFWYDDVDIYNFTTGTWSTASLSQARGFIAATTVGNKALFAGGIIENGVPSDVVDIYDYENDTWDTAHLSVARGFSDEHAATIDGRAYFVGGGTFDMPYWITDSDVIDIYDEANDEWSAMTMAYPRTNHSVAAVGASLLIAGGFTIVDFPYGIVHDLVEIYTDPDVGVPQVQSPKFKVQSYPNPTNGISHFTFHISQCQWVSIRIYNAQGQEVAVVLDQALPAGEHTVRWDATALPAGIYFYRTSNIDNRQSTMGKLVKY
jgi:hypothetical protein